MSSNEEETKSGSKNGQQETTKTRKMMNISVVFLDDSTFTLQMPCKALGRNLFDKVCKMLNLLEADYFGLEYEDDTSTKYWLDGLKPLCRQVGLTTLSPTFHFCVKFYTPDPVQLEDEFTRYLFSLQLKKDLATGVLHCNDNTAAVMISYIVQAELGDYDIDEFPDHCYLSRFKLIPYQDADLEKKIMESHKKHIGQTPAEAELNLLETARRCELYGIKMTAAKDQEGVPLNLAVAHLGVLVFQNFTKINIFSWAKIRKLSFKRKKFLIKLHPEGYGYYKDTVEFFFEGRNECKNFWKKCIENHTFFRCTDATKGMRQKPKLFSRGSSFRYSGRTQVQLSEYVRQNYVKRNFQRSTSLRTTPNSPSKPSDGSISPQPLLPVSASFSSESMVINTTTTPTSPPPKKLSASEPTTPHIAQDISPSVGNGIVHNRDSEPMSMSPGLTTPDSELGGYQTPDYLGQETDDNISHDSYHVTSLEPKEIAAFENKTYDAVLPPPEITADISIPSEMLEVMGNDEPDAKNNNGPLSQPVSNDAATDVVNSAPSDRIDAEAKPTNGHVSGEDSAIASETAKLVNGTGFMNGGLTQNGDSEGNYLEDVANACGDPLQMIGVPNFRSDSFSSLSEPQLLNVKRTPSDKAYYLAKELLMSERTYRRDLEIIDVVFREEFIKEKNVPSEAVESMLSAIGPLYEIHCLFLRDLEQRLAFWEGKHVKLIKNGVKALGDIFFNYQKMPELYEAYVNKLSHVLQEIHASLKSNESFAKFYHQFESLPVCYLPLATFLLRPVYRISHYCATLKALTNYYGKTHFDYAETHQIMNDFQCFFTKFEDKIPSLINYAKLMELEKNLVGYPLESGDCKRTFIREGCLQRLLKIETKQCMLFLFSDVLLCAEQIAVGKLQFKVQSCIPTSNMKVAKIEPRHNSNYCFTVQRGEKCLFLAASSEKERSRWIQDITSVIHSLNEKSNGFGPSSHRSEDDVSTPEENCTLWNDNSPISHHVNTSVHVCWHRLVSIGRGDLYIAVRYSLSGFLLRKFKNNSGWQKLWVVLSNLCLFFYKSYLEESPLASLPLSNYRVTKPSAEDQITKDCVFKLQYKNYDYFFRAESNFFLERWMEVIHYCTLIEDEKTRL